MIMSKNGKTAFFFTFVDKVFQVNFFAIFLSFSVSVKFCIFNTLCSSFSNIFYPWLLLALFSNVEEVKRGKNGAK
jgi:hypothetical protein